MDAVSRKTLKGSLDEAPRGGDSARSPILHSVKKLRDFWTRWQRKENKTLTGSLQNSGPFEEGVISARMASPVSSLKLEGTRRNEQSQRPLRYRRLLELARKASSRFSTSGSNVDFYRDDHTVASNHDSAKDPFLTSRARDLAFFGRGSAGMSSFSESTLSAYTDVSLEMSHRLQSHSSRSQDRHNTVFPSHLFRRSSLELSKTNYKRLNYSSVEDSDDLP